ncbi:family 16 glycosylhydrolase [Kineococcus sp. T13]|uniref:family 16 glycosylhydrolase n=1 Tax=Kineococcus vitellinus TaxID=2696565 RepID=UPI0014136C8C|nr:family 16 glycosylhydrolase [Kineococcus vitellinus]
MGSYTYFACARIAGQWQNIGSVKSFSVSAQSTSTTPTAAVVPPVGAASGWSLSFSDEFNGTAVDTSKWLPQRFSWGDPYDQPFNASEGASFSAKNVTVSNGAAVLTTKREASTAWGKSYTHTSGMLSSEGKFTLKRGDYIEARIWIPKSDGLWPAFWTVPSGQWPPEIDIFEFFDTAKQSQPKFNYHWGTSSNHQQLGPRTYGAAGVDYRNSWHTYGLHRTLDNRLVPYVDGVAYPAASVTSQDALPQFVILNLSMYAGANPSSTEQMKIDHVRAWSPKAS